MQVYRARLNGGTAPLTLTADLKRGGWAPTSTTIAAQTVEPRPNCAGVSPPTSAMTVARQLSVAGC